MLANAWEWIYGWYLAIIPNIIASVIWAAPAFYAHHQLLKRHMNRQHEELKKHIRQNTQGLHGNTGPPSFKE